MSYESNLLSLINDESKISTTASMNIDPVSRASFKSLSSAEHVSRIIDRLSPCKEISLESAAKHSESLHRSDENVEELSKCDDESWTSIDESAIGSRFLLNRYSEPKKECAKPKPIKSKPILTKEPIVKHLKSAKDLKRIYRLLEKITNKSSRHYKPPPNMIDPDKEACADLSDISDEDEDEDEREFTVLERKLMICVLDECLNKLVILGAKKEQFASTSLFHSAGLRLQDKHVSLIYEPIKNLVIPKYARKIREIKFQKERELMLKLLSLTRAELTDNGEVNSIYLYLTIENQNRSENIKIADSHYKNTLRLEELRRIEKKVKEETDETISEQKEELFTKKQYFETVKKVAITQMLYNYKWNSARYEQNTVLINRENQKMAKEMDKLEDQIKKEERAHREILNYLAISTKQLSKDFEYWNKQYNNDITKMELNVMNLESNIEDATLQLDLTEQAIKVEEKQLQILKKEKVIRDKRVADERLRDDSATKIQAWWRGTMVRWEFGKYADIMKKKFKKSRKSKIK